VIPAQASPHQEVNSGAMVVGEREIKGTFRTSVSVLLLASRIS